MSDPSASPDAKSVNRTVAWALGLGGLTLSMVVVAVMGIFAPWGWERFTDAYPIAMQMLRSCPLAVDALGADPDKTWGFSNFEIGSRGQLGEATYTTQVAGKKQQGEYQIFATRTFDAWTVQSATLLLPGERRIINVALCTEGPPAQ